jgi:hypothetical protein
MPAPDPVDDALGTADSYQRDLLLRTYDDLLEVLSTSSRWHSDAIARSFEEFDADYRQTCQAGWSHVQALTTMMSGLRRDHLINAAIEAVDCGAPT